MKEEEVKEVRIRRHGPNLGSLFLALVLILIGASFLLRNLGIVDITAAIRWELLWPLIIIFFGLSVLSGRHWVSFIIGLLVILLVLFLIVFSSEAGQEQGSRWRISTRPESISNQEFSIAREANISASKVEIKTGAGKLNLSGGANDIISGNYQSRFLTLDTSSKTVGTTQEISLSTRGSGAFSFGRGGNELSAKLNSVLPLDLTLDTGALEGDLDLRDVRLVNLDIDTGASDIDLRLGDKADLARIDVDAGASSIKIRLPKTVGARLTVESGVSSREIEDFEKINDNTYQSRNYNDMAKKIELRIDMGASSLEIKWE